MGDPQLDTFAKELALSLSRMQRGADEGLKYAHRLNGERHKMYWQGYHHCIYGVQSALKNARLEDAIDSAYKRTIKRLENKISDLNYTVRTLQNNQ